MTTTTNDLPARLRTQAATIKEGLEAGYANSDDFDRAAALMQEASSAIENLSRILGDGALQAAKEVATGMRVMEMGEKLADTEAEAAAWMEWARKRADPEAIGAGATLNLADFSEAEALRGVLDEQHERLVIDRDYYQSEARGVSAQAQQALSEKLGETIAMMEHDRAEIREFMASPVQAELAALRARVAAHEGVDADELQPLRDVVAAAGARMFCGETDPLKSGGRAMVRLFQELDHQDLLDLDDDSPLPGLIVELTARLGLEDDGE
jgi:hypothetical protein